MQQVLEKYMSYSNQKTEKNYLLPFWSYINFTEMLKKTKKSKYLSKYLVSWPENSLDGK